MASTPSEASIDDSGYFTGGAESRGGHLDEDDVIPMQQNSLIVAAMRGDEAEIRLLLDRQDVNPDFKCKGHTALWWAAKERHYGVVGLLLERNMSTQTPMTKGPHTTDNFATAWT